MQLFKTVLSLLFVFGFTLQGFSQDFSFTKAKAKTSGEVQYQVDVNEQRILNNLRKGSSLEYRLDGKSFRQTVKRVNQFSFGYTGVTGHPVQGNSYSNLMIKEGKLTGIMHFDGQPYRLASENGEYQFFPITEEAHQCSLDEVATVNNSLQKSVMNTGGEYAIPNYDLDDYSDTTTVDVLVLYTTKAKEWASGSNNSITNDIDEIFALNESFKNDIIENSELALKIRFVGYVEIDNATATSTDDKLDNMRNNVYTGSTHTSDTVDIHSLRNQFGADLVALVDSIQDTGGLGYRPGNIGGTSANAYTVSRVQQMSFNYVLMHEIGHNFGNSHGRIQGSAAAGELGGMFQFSTGYYFEASDGSNYNTVMHYGDSNSSDIPYFSNPRVAYLDSASGSYTGDGGPSDNALSMTLAKNWLADYRETVVDPPIIALSTTAIEDTVFPSGVSTRNIIIENTGDSDLEVKLDGEMVYSSALKMRKTIKQPLNIFYGFEESEGYETGTYSAYNNWKTTNDDLDFEITTSQSATGSQSLKIPMTSNFPSLYSPYLSTSSTYSSYNVSFKVYTEGSVSAILRTRSADDKLSSGVWFHDSNSIYFRNGGTNYTGSGDSYSAGSWYDVSVDISTDNGGEAVYNYEGETRTRSSESTFPEIFEISLQASGSSNYVYIDDLRITAEDLYGPALTISDNSMTIRPGETDTMTVTFYGNGYDEGVYDGNIYLTTNDPNNDSLTIPVDLRIDPNNLNSNGEFALELTGQAGFRLLAAPTDVNLMDFLEPLHTQGATNADVTNGGPVVWTWDKTFTGTTNVGWNPVADLDTTLSSGDAFLVYVFDETVYGDSTSQGFPKLLPISGTTVSSATPSVNQNADGLTMVGNPYPSTIDWDNVSTTELEDAIYIYDPNASSWESYVGGIGDITNGLIKAFQGFFVQSSASISSGPAISFDTGDISSGGDFYGKDNQKIFARFEVEDPKFNLSNSAWVVFNNQATEAKDSFDALEFLPLSADYIYTSTMASDGTELDINARPEFVDISISNGDWSKEIELNKSVSLDYTPNPVIQKNGFPVSFKKENLNEYKLVFSKRSTVSIEEPDVPQEFTLQQNYPNPFNPTTSIQFGLPTTATVKLSVYNVLGQLVDVLINERRQAGFHTVNFDAVDLSSGVYLFRIEAGSFVDSKKMVLMK